MKTTLLLFALGVSLLIGCTDELPPPPAARVQNAPSPKPMAVPTDPPAAKPLAPVPAPAEPAFVPLPGAPAPFTLAPAPPPEPLPPTPRLGPDSVVVPLVPTNTLFMEVSADKKTRRVLLKAEVCQTDMTLELFMCKAGTKEHEAVVRFDLGKVKKDGVEVELGAEQLHQALLAAGAKAGHPVQYIDPGTQQPKYLPPTGTVIDVTVHYRKDGRLHTHPAQEWILDKKSNGAAALTWVFAGSKEVPHPDGAAFPSFYGANSGDVIAVSNFEYALMDVTTKVSKDDADLWFGTRPGMIPPRGSAVWVILTPRPEK